MEQTYTSTATASLTKKREKSVDFEAAFLIILFSHPRSSFCTCTDAFFLVLNFIRLCTELSSPSCPTLSRAVSEAPPERSDSSLPAMVRLAHSFCMLMAKGTQASGQTFDQVDCPLPLSFLGTVCSHYHSLLEK